MRGKTSILGGTITKEEKEAQHLSALFHLHPPPNAAPLSFAIFRTEGEGARAPVA